MNTAICHPDPESDREKGRLQYAIEQFMQASREAPDTRAVFERAVLEMSRLMSPPGIPQKRLERSVADLMRLSDPDLLANLVTKLISTDRFVSREARVRLLGQKMFNDMLKEAGGVYSQEEAAELLSLTPGAVRKRQQANRLLAVLRGDHLFYPVWQFVDGGVVPHFEEVLKALDVTDAGKVRFFLTPDGDLKARPIDALHKPEKVDLVLRKARQFGTQVAT